MKGKVPAKFERNMLDKIMKNTSEEKKKMMGNGSVKAKVKKGTI
jgi:hypothetical protein